MPACFKRGARCSNRTHYSVNVRQESVGEKRYAQFFPSTSLFLTVFSSVFLPFFFNLSLFNLALSNLALSSF